MKSTPIIINNFNRLTTTRNMYEFLRKRDFTNIIILDNASTYPPLLEWYASLDTDVVRLTENVGAFALFDTGFISRFHDNEYIVHTDSDLELNPQMPDDFLEIMQSMLEKYEYWKIGVALRIDDVPENCSRNCTTGTIDHEKQFWLDEAEKDVYRAMVDTTFSLLKSPRTHDLNALRIAGNFTARHVPWYQDYASLNEEEKYYVMHANNQSNFRNGYLTWLDETK